MSEQFLSLQLFCYFVSAKFRDMITVEVRKEMSHQKCDKLDYMHQNLNHLSNLNLHHMTICKKGWQCQKG